MNEKTEAYSKEYYIWKAKNQRGLTEEQIQFFLDNHPRYDLLPHYSFFLKKGEMSESEALGAVIEMFGKE